MNITELRKMTTSERLQAMEVLLDSLVYENDAVETPEWHEKILQERKKMQLGAHHSSHSPISKRVASNENK